MLDSFDGMLDDYKQQGMMTLSSQGVLTASSELDTVNANKYKSEIGAFISEEGAGYTDLRSPLCGCCKK